MIVYEGLKTDFLHSVEQDAIAIEIERNIIEKMGRHVSMNEFRSWENSLGYMYKVLNDTEIPDDSGVAIEYNIPQTAKRIDFMISGYNESQVASTVVIELKQWDKIDPVEGVDALVETYIGGAVRRVVHPSYQVWSYAQLIKDYNIEVQDNNIELHPCVCMHNYLRKDEDPIDASQYEYYYEEAPVYTKGQLQNLREFIHRSIKTGDKKQTLYSIDNGKIRPSKSLQDSISSMLKGNDEFIMIDEQKVVYEEIVRLSEQCQKDNRKRTIIVKGGPGTGKSVVAINLLAELTNRDQMVQYVSKNSAPREVYKVKLKGDNVKASSIDNMFKGSGSYVDLGENVIQTILADEAHRLNEKSGMFHNEGENQIKEIIHAANCSVFFIDESQKVTMYDIGSVDEIKKHAEAENSEVIEMELLSQFRCNGSNGYLAWLDDVLEIRETANYDLEGIDFDVRLMDSPNEVRALVEQKNKIDNKARMLAGYCWEWIKEGKKDTNVYDIEIGDDFGMSWNLEVGDPFAVSETSVKEVGCIHTSQGLEFDYVGVIIGEDLRYEDDKIVTDFNKRAKSDQSLRGIKKVYKENPEAALEKADELIKNTYRTLLSRGMKGCYIYCVDEALGKYLKRRLEMGKDR